MIHLKFPIFKFSASQYWVSHALMSSDTGINCQLFKTIATMELGNQGIKTGEKQSEQWNSLPTETEVFTTLQF